MSRIKSFSIDHIAASYIINFGFVIPFLNW